LQEELRERYLGEIQNGSLRDRAGTRAEEGTGLLARFFYATEEVTTMVAVLPSSRVTIARDHDPRIKGA
jgi:hypothetical protein